MTQYVLDFKNNYAWAKIVFANRTGIVYCIDMMDAFHSVSHSRDSRGGGVDCVSSGVNAMKCTNCGKARGFCEPCFKCDSPEGDWFPVIQSAPKTLKRLERRALYRIKRIARKAGKVGFFNSEQLAQLGSARSIAWNYFEYKPNKKTRKAVKLLNCQMRKGKA